MTFKVVVSAKFCAVVRFSCMVAFLTDIRLVFRSSLGNQQIHIEYVVKAVFLQLGYSSFLGNCNCYD